MGGETGGVGLRIECGVENELKFSPSHCLHGGVEKTVFELEGVEERTDNDVLDSWGEVEECEENVEGSNAHVHGVGWRLDLHADVDETAFCFVCEGGEDGCIGDSDFLHRSVD